jgi:hypothetical protein
MKIVNNRIYIVRGETPTYDVSVINKDNGAPFVVLEKFLNPTIDFVVRPSVYSRDDEYVFRAYLKMKNIHKFPTEEIVDYPVDGPWDNSVTPVPGNEQKLHRRTVATATGNVYEYSYYADGKWVRYEFRITFMFPHYATKVMEPKTYQYEVTLLGGNVKVGHDGKDISSDLETTQATAFDKLPIDVVYKKPLLDPTDFVVGGSMSE